MSKEKFKKALEEAPDYKPFMENMFGPAYLDHPDDTEKLPSDLQQVSDTIDGQIFDISGLVNRAIEQAPKITCLENQTLLLKFLDGYMRDGNPETTFEDSWTMTKHMEKCYNKDCWQLENIARLDKYLLPNVMRDDYGEVVEKHHQRLSEK